jgi:hypothetical protein
MAAVFLRYSVCHLWNFRAGQQHTMADSGEGDLKHLDGPSAAAAESCARKRPALVPPLAGAAQQGGQASKRGRAAAATTSNAEEHGMGGGPGVRSVSTETRRFDLNTKTVLRQWDVADALRELLANAEDETRLACAEAEKQLRGCSLEPNHKEEGDVWHVRDFGRGIHYTHLTQNECPEKLSAWNSEGTHMDAPDIIGCFGVGLKDALAVLHRNGVQIEIRSKYSNISVEMSTKHAFEDVTTLHAVVSPPSHPSMQGTDFVLTGVKRQDVDAAKAMFLRFTVPKILKKVPAGSILEKSDPHGRGAVYFRGLKITDLDERFLFSYNIRAVNARLKKAMNRERKSVGLTELTALIKKVLLSDEDAGGNEEVARIVCENLVSKGQSEDCYELKWKDIKVHYIQEQAKRSAAAEQEHREALRKSEAALVSQTRAAREAEEAAMQAKMKQAQQQKALHLQELAAEQHLRVQEQLAAAELAGRAAEAEQLRQKEEQARVAMRAKEAAAKIAKEDCIEAEKLRFAKEADEKRKAAELRKSKEKEAQIAATNKKGGSVMFATPDEGQDTSLRQLYAQAKRSHKLVVIDKSKLDAAVQDAKRRGDTVLTFQEYCRDVRNEFKPQFIQESELSESERSVWARKDAILELVGGRPKCVKHIHITETINPFQPCVGLWRRKDGTILIARKQLKDFVKFAGTLIHEAAHAESGAADETSAFEHQLTRWLGVLASQCTLEE